MVLELDVLDYCRKLRTTQQPPYICPVEECKKTYKSICGFQYHLVNFKHETEIVKPKSISLGSYVNSNKNSIDDDAETQNELKEKPPDAKCFIEIEVDGKIHKIDINESLPVVSQHSYDLLQSKKPTSAHKSIGDKHKQKVSGVVKLPEPHFKVVDDYAIPNAPPRPSGYIRFIEKSGEEMEGEVEYDLDEEDTAWLETVNEERIQKGMKPVPVDVFETLMDRLERESYFQSRDATSVVDDEAVCCICLDGDCQNSNAILFCDMCNMAVHQDCYGVPFIPEEQWICRRCLHSPSRPVDCVLCPDTGGAFKQTDRRHWVHVVCALWIPEVRFANTVFLEPVDSIETVPAARWRLNCSLCDMKGVGACIQCSKANCYAAFHVTCARKSGLHMDMKTTKNSVEKVVYCKSHTPEGVELKPPLPLSQSGPHTISLPTIPPERIQEIGEILEEVERKNVFLRRSIAYWTLKRQMRNGVPLLRSLQASHLPKRETSALSGDSEEVRKRLEYWYKFRQDLERARLLCELVRKRERLKRDLTRASADSLQLRLIPLVCVLRNLHDVLRRDDHSHIFLEPPDMSELPNYSKVILEPIDLSTMRARIEDFYYNNINDYVKDFNLMIDNCLEYYKGNSVFTDSALKFKTRGEELFKKAEIDLSKLLEELEIPIINTNH